MTRFLPIIAAVLAASPAGADMPVAATMPYPVVEVETSAGRFVVQLDRPRAPLTVDNFIRYVLDGHYDGTVIHRVIDGFVVQGGGYDADFGERPTREPIVNESGNGLSNARGTIAMARGDDPHSARAQWYINVGDNQRLDPTPRRWGYAVFGRVLDGMDVVERIAASEAGPAGPFPADVPAEPVVIESIRFIEPPEDR